MFYSCVLLQGQAFHFTYTYYVKASCKGNVEKLDQKIEED